MALKYTVGILSLLSGAAHAAPASKCHRTPSAPAATTNVSSPATPATPATPAKLQLIPVSNANRVNTAGRNVVPQKNLNLAWQTPNNDSLVSVGLVMQNTAVALEDVDDVASVDCTGNSSVAVTFNSTEAFDEAFAEWSALSDSFVIITNHLGDCDSELERSFFVADSDTLASYADNLTIVATAEKSDVVSTASKSRPVPGPG